MHEIVYPQGKQHAMQEHLHDRVRHVQPVLRKVDVITLGFCLQPEGECRKERCELKRLKYSPVRSYCRKTCDHCQEL